MTEAPAPIELAPSHRRTSRRKLHVIRVGARWAHLALSLAIVLSVFVQVYLIGAYIFGAGQGALDAHRTAGFALQGPELFVLLTALIAGFPDRSAPSFLVAFVALSGRPRQRPSMDPRPPSAARARPASPAATLELRGSATEAWKRELGRLTRAFIDPSGRKSVAIGGKSVERLVRKVQT